MSDPREKAREFFGCRLVDKDRYGVAGEAMEHSEACEFWVVECGSLNEAHACDALTVRVIDAVEAAEERFMVPLRELSGYMDGEHEVSTDVVDEIFAGHGISLPTASIRSQP